MRSTTTRATAVEGVRTFAPDRCGQCGYTYSEADAPTAEDARHIARACAPVWRARALDPEGMGVSVRFRYPVIDLTGRIVGMGRI